MIALILPALHELLSDIKIPQYETRLKLVNIDEVKPMALTEFIKDNNTPENAYFDTDGEYIFLAYTVEVLASKEFQTQYLAKKFNANAFNRVYKALTPHDYQRISFQYSIYKKKFYKISLYELFTSKRYDELEEYFSLMFKRRES